VSRFPCEVENRSYGLREHLAPHKTPRHWFQVDEFPLTGSGKIQKFVLRDQWVDGQWTELA
jgi:fatty-acyl-CoA synthase